MVLPTAADVRGYWGNQRAARALSDAQLICYCPLPSYSFRMWGAKPCGICVNCLESRMRGDRRLGLLTLECQFPKPRFAYFPAIARWEPCLNCDACLQSGMITTPRSEEGSGASGDGDGSGISR